MTRKQQATYQAVAEFFREAAVLVCVFANLDRVIHSGKISLLWAGGTLGTTLLLFIFGLWVGAQIEE
jgi:hypothetical protein